MMKKYLLEPFKPTNNIRPNRSFCHKKISGSNIIMKYKFLPILSVFVVAGVSLLWIGMSFESGDPEWSQYMVFVIAVLCAILWVTEWLPIPVTSLLPFVCFPLLGIFEGKIVAQSYGHPMILLLMGGFILKYGFGA